MASVLSAGLELRALLTGPRTGRLYVIANDRRADGTAALVLQVRTAGGRRLLVQRTVKERAGTVFGAAVSRDEQRIAVAYHGDAEGFDLVSVPGMRLACFSPASGGCHAGHGSVHFAGTRLFTATGSSAFGVLTAAGDVARHASRLLGNHLLEMASDRTSLFLLGACGYGGGLARVNLRSLAASVVASGRRVCGSRLVTTTKGLLVAANPVPVPPPTAASRIRLIDQRTGRVRWSSPAAGAAIDLLAPRA